MDPCKFEGADGKCKYSIKHGNWLWEACKETKVVKPTKFLQDEEASQWMAITPLEYLLATGINFHGFVIPEKRKKESRKQC